MTRGEVLERHLCANMRVPESTTAYKYFMCTWCRHTGAHSFLSVTTVRYIRTVLCLWEFWPLHFYIWHFLNYLDKVVTIIITVSKRKNGVPPKSCDDEALDVEEQEAENEETVTNPQREIVKRGPGDPSWSEQDNEVVHEKCTTKSTKKRTLLS